MGGLTGKIEERRREVTARLADLAAMQRQYASVQSRLAAAEDRVEVAEEAEDAVNRVAERIQRAAVDRVAAIVGRSLLCLDRPYECAIDWELRRGRTEAVIRLRDLETGELVSPMDSTGGGVVDLASFSLRLACLVLQSRASRRLLILDEPFRFLSARYRPHAQRMLDDLAAELGMQIILVTHYSDLEHGVVVEL